MNLETLNRLPRFPKPEFLAEHVRRGRHPCSLSEFVVAAWPILNPSTPLVWGWHLWALCAHVEAQLLGSKPGKQWRQNLVINVPPGSSKSTITSVCATAWNWLRDPGWRVLCLSGNPDVATRDSVATRRLIESDWYQQTFRPNWKLSSDANVKTRFENTAAGFRQSKGWEAQVTGDRPHAIIGDDPIDAKEASSELARTRANSAWDLAIAGRIADMQTGTRTIIMQRLSEDDLSGHVLAEGGWGHLKLEMERETQQSCTCADCKSGETFIGFQDPRTADGELLDPVRFPYSALAQEKHRLGGDYDGQMQQNPLPSGGIMFDTTKIRVIEARPPPDQIKHRVRGWDLAASDLGAWTVGVELLELRDGRFCIADVIRFRSKPGIVEQTMLDAATRDGKQCPIVGPRDPGQAGVSQEASLTKMLKGYMAFFVSQTGSKEVRATPFSRQVAIGNVVLVDAEWNMEYLKELRSFPRGKYKDQVDATSEGFNWITASGSDTVHTLGLLSMGRR